MRSCRHGAAVLPLLILSVALLLGCRGPDVEAPPLPVIPNPAPTLPQNPWDNEYINGAFPTPLPAAAAQEILARSRIFLIPPPPDPEPGRGSFYYPPMLARDDSLKAMHSAARKIQAFNVLLDDPAAPARFESLFRTNAPVPQLYALCGLRLVDHERYGELAPLLAGSKRDVTHSCEAGGCMSIERTMGEVVQDISRGEYCARMRDLRAAAQKYLDRP